MKMSCAFGDGNFVECAFSTLGIVVALSRRGCVDVVSTLGDVISLSRCGFGAGIERLSNCAIVTIALRVSSPTVNVGTVVECGVVRIVTISSAACLRKSSRSISGKGTDFGKKVTVSVWRSALVDGK